MTDRKNSINPDKDSLLSLLLEAGVGFIDKRSKGGCLWVLGGIELSDKLESLGLKSYFRYSKNGSKATNHQEAWWTTENSIPASDDSSASLKNFREVLLGGEGNASTLNSSLSNSGWLIDDGWRDDKGYSEALKDILLDYDYGIEVDNQPESPKPPKKTSVVFYPEDEKVIPLSKSIAPGEEMLSIRVEDVIQYYKEDWGQLSECGVNTVGDLLATHIADLANPLKRNDIIDDLRHRFAYDVVLKGASLDSGEYILPISDGFLLSSTLLNVRVDNIPGLTPGIYRALPRIGCEVIGDLTTTTIERLRSIKGIGIGAVSKIRKSFCSSYLYAASEHDSIGKENQCVIDLSDDVALSELEKSFSIDSAFNLAPSVIRALSDLGCETIGDLLELPAGDLLRQKGIGKKTIVNLRNEFRAKIIAPRGLLPDDLAKSFKRGDDDELNEILGDSYTPCPQRLGYISAMQIITEGITPVIPCAPPSILDWLAKDSSMIDEIEEFAKSHSLGEHENISCCLNGEAYSGLIFDSLSTPLDVLKQDRHLTDTESFITGLLNTLPLGKDCEQFVKERADNAERALCASIRDVPLRWVSQPEFWNEVPLNLTLFEAVTSTDNVLALILAEAAIESLWLITSLYSQSNNAKELIAQCIRDLSNSAGSRSISIFLMHEGFEDVPMTLQEIGERLGVTRERVRQLEKHATKDLRLDESLRFLPTRLSMLAIAFKMGLAGSLEEFCKTSSEVLAFDKSEIDFLARHNPDFVVGKGNFFVVKGYPCASCAQLESVASQIRKEKSMVLQNDFAESVGCPTCEKGARLYIPWAASEYGIAAIDGNVGSRENTSVRAMLNPDSVRAQLHAILTESTTSMTYDEILDAYERRTGKTTSKMRVSSQIQSFNDCILWGRGTYIHERNAPFPEALLNEIASFAFNHFKNERIPLIGVKSLYDKYVENLSDSGIPGGEALYGLLRRLNDSRLLLQEYPWVCDSDTVGDRTTFAKYFYSVLSENNGYITDEHAELIAEKTMAQAWALGGLAEYSRFLIQADGGWYNVEAAGFDLEGLRDLSEDVASKMEDGDIISAKKVFDDYRERCFTLGIKSFDMLYRLIDLIEEDLPITATRMPHLAKTKGESVSVTDVVRNYIRSSLQPVTHMEIIEEFGKKRGIKTSGLCQTLILGGDIVLVGTETYWSTACIDFGDDIIKRFDEAVTMITSNAPKIAGLFYSLNQVMQNYGSLPALKSISWTPELVTEAFKRSNAFKVFGPNNNCVVDLRLTPEVRTVELFYWTLIEQEFHGWALFDTFSEFCDAYEIREDIQPEFFDSFDSVYATPIEIKTIKS